MIIFNKQKIAKSRSDERGMILVLTLMIMSVLLSTALGFGIFIISDLKQSQSVDDAVLAYYAADAGLEKSLFLLRKQEIGSIGEASNSAPGTLLGVLGAGNKTLGNKAKWNIASSRDYEENFFRQRLNNGQSVKLYFLGRNAAPRLNKTDKVKVYWYKGKKIDGTSSDIRLQIIFTQLDPQWRYNPDTDDSPILVYYTDQSPDPLFSDSSVEENIEFNLQDEVVPYCYQSSCGQKIHDYVMEIRAVAFDRNNSSNDDFVDSLRVVAYDQDNKIVSKGITSLAIKSVGTYRQSRQQLSAYLSPHDPLSSMLGFVLFSEEDITKSY